MGLFNFNKKKEQKQDVSRIDVEDMIDQGYSCKEIAEELGTTQKAIYRIKNARYRRSTRLMGGQIEDDGVNSTRQEIEKAKLQDQLEEIKHRNYLRQMERQDIEAEDMPDLAQAAENPDSLITNLLMSAFLKGKAGNSTGVLPSGVVNPSTEIKPVESPANAGGANVDVQQIIKAIKGDVVSRDAAIQKMVEQGLQYQQAEKLYKFVKEKL